MDMRLDQTRCNKTAANVDDAGFRPDQRANLFIAVHGQDTTVLDCDGLRVRQGRVGGEDLGIDQDQLRGGERARGQQQ